MDVGAGLVGLLVGLVVSPLADRLATNAPLHDPLLKSVPRSRRLWLVALGTAGLGIPVIVAMFVGFFVAFVPAGVLFVRHGKDARKQSIPLGPFLALGGVIALFWGDAILDWYQDLGQQ